jgi:hypothetical protein
MDGYGRSFSNRLGLELGLRLELGLELGIGDRDEPWMDMVESLATGWGWS